MNAAKISETLAALGLPGAEQAEKIAKYFHLVVDWNRRINLTAITDPEQFLVRHVIDCLWLARAETPRGALADVGSGAGFPGLLLALCLPHLQVTMIDATEKKVGFLRHCCRQLHIDATVIHDRAETLGHSAARESFDWVVARALAPLPVLAEYCLPLTRVGGVFVAYKGPAVEQEVRQATNAIALLGGKVREQHCYQLPDGSERSLVVVEKQTTTLEKFPRRPGMPARRPLGSG